MRQQVIIFGSGGFIGGHLFAELSSLGRYKVTGLTSQQCDLLRYDNCRMLLESIQPGAILVFAAGVTRLVDNSVTVVEKNTRMVLNLCRIVEQTPISKFLFLSTIDVYGVNCNDIAIREDTPAGPDDYYALSKLISEQILLFLAHKRGFSLTIFRLSGIYGPGDAGKSTMYALTKSLLDDGQINIFGKGESLRDFVWVSDLSRLVGMVLQQKVSGVYNIATGNSCTISTIAKKLIQHHGSGRLHYVQENKEEAQRAKYLSFDTAKLKNDFPGHRFVSLDDAIKQYLRRLDEWPPKTA